MPCPVLNGPMITALSIKPSLRTDPSLGTQIDLYDMNFIWTAEHLPPSKLNQWRKKSDRLLDPFFERFGKELKTGEDTYQFIQQLSLQTNHICDDYCKPVCLCNIDRMIREKPDWFDREQIRKGQIFFLKHCSLAVTCVFYYTLLLGYGFQQLNDVLVETQYLLSSKLTLTYRRLIETLQMIASVVTGDVDEFEQTFSDVVRVRLLHAMVRYKVKKSHQSLSDEIPINQEDSLITLLGFSFGVLYCIQERIGIEISEDDKTSYLCLWRYVGWLIGIEQELLYYLSSYKLARIISESIFYHYYLPSETSKHLVYHSLMAAYKCGPLPFSFEFHVGVSQRLLGKSFSEALDVHKPVVDRFNSFWVTLLVKSFQFGSWLARLKYPILNDWLIKRNKQRLNTRIRLALNNQLRNFACFKPSFNNAQKPTESCPCGYYERKCNVETKINKNRLFERKSLMPGIFVFNCVLFLSFLLCMIRY